MLDHVALAILGDRRVLVTGAAPVFPETVLDHVALAILGDRRVLVTGAAPVFPETVRTAEDDAGSVGRSRTSPWRRAY